MKAKGSKKMSDNQRLLVTGASGHLGRRVVELLLEANAGQIIATTRNPEKLADFAERGVELRHADFNDEASLSQAFAGADRLLLISTDALDALGTRLKQQTAAVRAAEAAGVKHVIYSSFLNAPTSPVIFAPDHAGTEKALENSSLGYTVLRYPLYADLLISGLNQAYQMGGLFKATGEGKTTYLSREDCARVAAAALNSDFQGRRILDITGSEAVSQAELAALATSITGQRLNYTAIPLEALIEGMVGAGLPLPVAETYASIDTAIAAGTFDLASNDFEALTGQKPTSIQDFLKANKDALLAGVTAQ
jgi:NAD(P)H dehydrogenase (quinone)